MCSIVVQILQAYRGLKVYKRRVRLGVRVRAKMRKSSIIGRKSCFMINQGGTNADLFEGMS